MAVVQSDRPPSGSHLADLQWRAESWGSNENVDDLGDRVPADHIEHHLRFFGPASGIAFDLCPCPRNPAMDGAPERRA